MLFAISVKFSILLNLHLRHSKSEVYKWLWIWHKCKCISVVDIPTWILLTILLFIDCSKMARIRFNTRTHTKEKPYLINSYFFKIRKAKKVNRVSKIRVRMWVRYVLKEFFVTFSWWLKNVKSRSKIALFFKWAPFWNLISKKENNNVFLK